MNVSAPCATNLPQPRTLTFHTAVSSPTRAALQNRDRKGAPMARRGPRKYRKVRRHLPNPNHPIPSRDRQGADLPQPDTLTFTRAVLPIPLGTVRKEPPQQ